MSVNLSPWSEMPKSCRDANSANMRFEEAEQRIAELEAEIERLKERLDEIAGSANEIINRTPLIKDDKVRNYIEEAVNPIFELAEDGIGHGDSLLAEIDRMKAELDKYRKQCETCGGRGIIRRRAIAINTRQAGVRNDKI